MEALLTLADDMVCAIAAGHEPDDVRHRAHPVEVDGFRIGQLRIALGEHPDLPLLADGLLGGEHGALASDGDREDHLGKQHHVPDWKYDQRICGGRWLGSRGLVRSLWLGHQRSPIFSRRMSRQP